MALAVLAWGGLAHGQDGLGPAESAFGVAEQPVGAVQISMESFGVGGVTRPGEWTGIRLALTDTASAPRPVAVRLHLRDEDGDTMLVERRVTLNPARALGVWLYGRMPWTITDSTLYTVTVHELSDAEDGGGEVMRQLAAARIKPQRVADPQSDLIAVIGPRPYGLTQLETVSSGVGSMSANIRLPTSHHMIETVMGLTPQQMPDMWMGLAAHGVVVWGADSPMSLGSDVRARAIKEWVRRGGHLVVVVPAVGSEWFAEANPLRELMPAVTPRVVSGASLEGYRWLLTSREFERQPLPESVDVTTFEIAAHAEPGEATPVIVGPHGCVVARRIVGAGMVSVIGLPLDEPRLMAGELFRADAFWHRILGYRFDTLSSAGQTKVQLARSVFPLIASRYIGAQVTQESKASAGLFLAMLLFIVYWVVAGPAGHWLLGRAGLVRHSWVLFVASIAVFAVAAWIGSSMTRPTRVAANHLTFLDHVHGQSTQRTTTWASILLPEYGDATIRLDEEGVNEQWRQAIAVWSEPQSEMIPFPDARDYIYDLRTPNQITVPTRATIKQFRFDWLGGKRWSTPIAVAGGAEPRLTPTGIQGVLAHDLPGPLEDVVVILQPGQTSDSHAEAEGNQRVIGRAQRWAIDSWAPQQPLDLAQFAAIRGKTGTQLMEPWASAVVSAFTPGFGAEDGPYTAANAAKDYVRLSLYSMLDPPDYLTDKAGQPSRPPITRMEGHGLDLGRWLTQPCLIVIGTVKRTGTADDAPGAPTPTPLLIRDGSRFREIPSEGWTVVRWIYPLAGEPARFSGGDKPPSP